MAVQRYNAVAITLHWVMAICFVLMLGSGLAMINFIVDPSLKFQLFQWHKSLGVLLLLAFFLRLAVRLVAVTPPLPPLPKWERFAAKLGHIGLYVWMIALPLTGWAMVSASPYGLPTIVFGWFEWPHVEPLYANEGAYKLAKLAHWVMAYIFIALILGHIGAVIKHTVHDKTPLLRRMWFFKKGE